MDIATLGVRIDSADVKKGADDLDRLTESAVRAEAAVEDVGPAFEAAGQRVEKGTQRVEGAAGVYKEFGSKASKDVGAVAEAAGRAAPKLDNLGKSVDDNAAAFAKLRAEFGSQFEKTAKDIERVAAAEKELVTASVSSLGAFGAIATAVAVLAAWATVSYKAQKETFEFYKAIELTGNAAGVTGGQLAAMAARIDDIIGTEAAAASALAQFVSTGKVAAENLERFTIVAAKLQQTAGIPVADTIKIFAELGRDPVQAAFKLQQQYGFLTSAVYDQIVALQKEGNELKAAEVAQTAFADAMDQRMDRLDERLGSLQRAARGTANFFREMWDAVLDVGRAQSPEEELAALQNDQPRLYSPQYAKEVLASREERKAALKEQITLAAETADAERKLLNVQNILIEASKELEEADKRRYQEAKQAAAAKLTLDLGAIQRDLKSVTSAYANYEAILDAQRKAGLTSEQEYYAAKRQLIGDNAAVQIKALEAENARIKAENVHGPEQIANQNKIAENEAAIAQIRNSAITQIQRLNTEQVAANAAIARSYDEARAAAQEYLDVIVKQYERSLDGQGQGVKQREFDAGRNALDDRFAGQRSNLAGELRRGDITKEQYDQQLAIINEFHQKAIGSYEQYWNKLTEKQGSFFTGASEAIHNYIDEAANMSKMTEGFFNNLFDGAEDALIGFVKTGKGEIKDLADSILAEFVRIQFKTLVAGVLKNSTSNILGSIVGGLFSAFGGAGAVGGTGAGMGVVASGGGALFADTGIKRVPKDNQPFLLHKDEAVLPRSMNPWAGGSMGGGVSFGDTIIYGNGLSLAQVDALVQQRNAELEQRVYENSNRKRWDI